jgi:hypothetical protein
MIWTLILAHWRLAAWGGLAAALAVALGLWRMEAGRAERLQASLAAAQAAAAASQAHAAAATDAASTVAAGAQRDAATQSLHQENEHALQAAPGSGQGLDPALNDAGRRGLCAYRAYSADPACVQLLGPGSGQRPDAGASDPPAGG